MSDITYTRCIEPRSVRPDIFDCDSPVLPFDGAELYLVLGIARNVTLDDSGRHVMVGEFEAMVLGRPGRVQSRTCLLLECEASAMLKTHIMRHPLGYELAGVCLAYQTPESDTLTRYVLRHLHIIGDPTRG